MAWSIVKHYLTKEQQAGVVRMYQRGVSAQRIAQCFRCGRTLVYRILHEAGIVLQDSNAPPYVPTLEAIAAATEKIRKEWDEQREREARGVDSDGWTPPTVTSLQTMLGRMGRATKGA